MSGFSPEWLALREPADLAARSLRVLQRCAATFDDRDRLSICDIGAGTGASVRAFAGLLPGRQTWTLIDHDAANLAVARRALGEWAERVEERDGEQILCHGDRRIEIRTLCHDFARDIDCSAPGTDLVTASALFDLTSREWIARFVAVLAARGTAMLATLSVDGTIAFTPPDPLDDGMTAAFRTHQRGDKGFGPAAGADAAVFLERRLKDAGYELEAAESPWILGKDTSALCNALLTTIEAAVRETDAVAPADLSRWRRARARETRSLTIGHRDVFAWRGGGSTPAPLRPHPP